VKHIWLALDPGITTGWALLDDEGRLRGTSVWGTAELKEALDILIRMSFTAGYTMTVVEERMPSAGGLGELARKLEAVRADIRKIVEETYELPVIWVTPGEWKPSRAARMTKTPPKFNGTPLMTHQKDAIKMARYAQEARRT